MKIIKTPDDVLNETFEAMKTKYSDWQPEITCTWCKAILRVRSDDLIRCPDESFFGGQATHNSVGVVCPCCKRNIRVYAPTDLAFFITTNDPRHKGGGT